MESIDKSTRWFTIHELSLVALHDQLQRSNPTQPTIQPNRSELSANDDQLNIVDHLDDIEALQWYMIHNTPCIVKNIGVSQSHFSPFPTSESQSTPSPLQLNSTPSWPIEWGINRGLVSEGGSNLPTDPQHRSTIDSRPYPNYFSNPSSNHADSSANPDDNDNDSYISLQRVYGDELQQRLDSTRINFEHFHRYYRNSDVSISDCATRDSNSQECNSSTLGTYLDEWGSHLDKTRSLMAKDNPDLNSKLTDYGPADSNDDHHPDPHVPFLQYCRDWHLSVHHHQIYQNQSSSHHQNTSNNTSIINKKDDSTDNGPNPPIAPQFYLPPLCVANDTLNQYWDYLSLAHNHLSCQYNRGSSEHSQPQSSAPPPMPQPSPQIDDYRFVYFGPQSSFTPVHRDVYASYSWSGNVVGVKLWIFLPPSYVRVTQTDPISSTVDLFDLFDEKLVHECSEQNSSLFGHDNDPMNNTPTQPACAAQSNLYQSLQSWISALRTRVCNDLNPTAASPTPTPSQPSQSSSTQSSKPIIFLQFPGDLVFVPSFWAHQVINLTDCISINHNWGNGFNYALMTSQLLFDCIAIQAGLDEYNDDRSSSNNNNNNKKWWEFEQLFGHRNSKNITQYNANNTGSKPINGNDITTPIYPFVTFDFQPVGCSDLNIDIDSSSDYVSFLLTQIKPLNISDHSLTPDRQSRGIVAYHSYPLERTLTQTGALASKATQKLSILDKYQHLLPLDNSKSTMYSLWDLPKDCCMTNQNKLWSFRNVDHQSKNLVIQQEEPFPTQVLLNLQAIVNIIQYYQYTSQYLTRCNDKIDQHNSHEQKRMLEQRQSQFRLMSSQPQHEKPNQQLPRHQQQPGVNHLPLKLPPFKPLPHLNPPPNLLDAIITQQRLLHTNSGMSFASWYQTLTIQQLASIGHVQLIIQSILDIINALNKIDSLIQTDNTASIKTLGPLSSLDLNEFSPVSQSDVVGSFMESIFSLLESPIINPLNNKTLPSSAPNDILDASDIANLFIKFYECHIVYQKSLRLGHADELHTILQNGVADGLLGYHFDAFEMSKLYGLLPSIIDINDNIDKTFTFIATTRIDDGHVHANNSQETSVSASEVAYLTEQRLGFTKSLNRLYRALAHIIFTSIESIKSLDRLFEHTNFSVLYHVTMTIAQSERSVLNQSSGLDPHAKSRNPFSQLLFHLKRKGAFPNDVGIQATTSSNDVSDDNDHADDITDSLLRIYHQFVPYPLTTSTQQQHNHSQTRPIPNVVPFIDLRRFMAGFVECVVPIFRELTQSIPFNCKSHHEPNHDPDSGRKSALDLNGSCSPINLSNIIICDRMLQELWDLSHQ